MWYLFERYTCIPSYELFSYKSLATYLRKLLAQSGAERSVVREEILPVFKHGFRTQVREVFDTCPTDAKPQRVRLAVVQAGLVNVGLLQGAASHQ